MLENRLSTYFSSAESPKDRDLKPIREAVVRGLRLEKELEDRDVVYSAISEMTNEIVVASFHAVNFLKNPGIPNFGLVYPWGSKPEDKNKLSVLADADIDSDNPYGLIRFSPKYLETVADYHMGIDDSNVLSFGEDAPLGAITAHEHYHISQFLRFHGVMEKQLCAAATSSEKELSEWNKTRAEKAARRFETLFDTHSLKLK